jgi:hypothetical protein
MVFGMAPVLASSSDRKMEVKGNDVMTGRNLPNQPHYSIELIPGGRTVINFEPRR